MSDSLTARTAAQFRTDRDAAERLRRKTRPNSAVREDFEHSEHIEHIDQYGITGGDRWPQPDRRLVEDGRAPSPRLDDDALPAGWDEWIEKEAAARGCPRDYLAAALIGAASAWIGNSRHVAVNETWSEPPHLWLALDRCTLDR